MIRFTCTALALTAGLAMSACQNEVSPMEGGGRHAVAYDSHGNLADAHERYAGVYYDANGNRVSSLYTRGTMNGPFADRDGVPVYTRDADGNEWRNYNNYQNNYDRNSNRNHQNNSPQNNNSNQNIDPNLDRGNSGAMNTAPSSNSDQFYNIRSSSSSEYWQNYDRMNANHVYYTANNPSGRDLTTYNAQPQWNDAVWEATTPVSDNDLPTGVRSTFQKMSSGNTVSEAGKTTWSGKTCYCSKTTINGVTYKMATDADGNLLWMRRADLTASR